jgi:hypothetical protein
MHQDRGFCLTTSHTDECTNTSVQSPICARSLGKKGAEQSLKVAFTTDHFLKQRPPLHHAYRTELQQQLVVNETAQIPVCSKSSKKGRERRFALGSKRPDKRPCSQKTSETKCTSLRIDAEGHADTVGGADRCRLRTRPFTPQSSSFKLTSFHYCHAQARPKQTGYRYVASNEVAVASKIKVLAGTTQEKRATARNTNLSHRGCKCTSAQRAREWWRTENKERKIRRERTPSKNVQDSPHVALERVEQELLRFGRP